MAVRPKFFKIPELVKILGMGPAATEIPIAMINNMSMMSRKHEHYGK